MRPFYRLLFVLLSLTFIAEAAFGQALRTFVSGFGDDTNPCSRTAPCRTFSAAIARTIAGGEVDVLDAAGYGAGLTINKSIIIDGTPVKAGILASGTDGIT